MMRKHPLVAFFALLLLSSPTIADSPSADSMAAARELIVTIRATDQYKAIIPAIIQNLKPAIVQNRPEVAQDFDALVPLLLEVLTPHLNELAEATADLYAAHFTAGELRQVTEFYRTPAGEKFLQKLPVVTQESMALGQKFGQVIAAEVRARMIEELRKRGHPI